MENIDLVIVTVEDEYSQIKSELEKLVKADIVKVSYLLGVSEGKYTS